MKETGFVHAWKTDGAIHSNSDAVAPWWSITKTVIAVACLKLAENGTVVLDAPVTGHLFTLRQLLRHTAGVPDYWRLQAYHDAVARQETAWPPNKLLDVVNAETLDFQPEQGWAYSNTGYLIARQVMEDAAEEALSSIVGRLVFEPLGMHSAFIIRDTVVLEQCKFMAGSNYDAGWVYHGLAAGTASDAVRFLDAVLNTEFLDAASKANLLSRTDIEGSESERPWHGFAYGLGLMCGEMKDAGRAIGHSGGSPVSVSALYHFPELKKPVTACAFHDGADEGITEWETVRLAVAAQ